jgi:hypothetical protein
MSRYLRMLLLLTATGCAGRWMELPEPIRPARRPVPLSYRVVLLKDSVVVLHDALIRNDSIVEVPDSGPERTGAPRAVALADAAVVEQWQPGGERITGGITLTIVGGLLLFFYLLSRAVGGPGS